MTPDGIKYKLCGAPNIDGTFCRKVIKIDKEKCGSHNSYVVSIDDVTPNGMPPLAEIGFHPRVPSVKTGAKFLITKEETGFSWELWSQGRVMARSSIVYTKKASCINALESVRQRSMSAAVIDTCTGDPVLRCGEWSDKNSRGEITPEMRQTIWDLDRGICHLCKEAVDLSEDWHVEHAIPWSLGGSNDICNLRVSHPLCNLSKHNRRIDPQRPSLRHLNVRPLSLLIH